MVLNDINRLSLRILSIYHEVASISHRDWYQYHRHRRTAIWRLSFLVTRIEKWYRLTKQIKPFRKVMSKALIWHFYFFISFFYSLLAPCSCIRSFIHFARSLAFLRIVRCVSSCATWLGIGDPPPCFRFCCKFYLTGTKQNARWCFGFALAKQVGW